MAPIRRRVSTMPSTMFANHGLQEEEWLSDLAAMFQECEAKGVVMEV